MNLVIGSYATPPRPLQTRSEFELLSAGVLALTGVDGLEVPYLGAGSPWQDATHLRMGGGRHVLTTVPSMMSAIERDPAFGLASDDDDARAAAVQLIADARAFVADVNAGAGATFGTVLLHSAPGRGRSTPEALARSLDEIAAWDWAGASLAVEHCDALVPSHAPDKGFLGLDQELALAAARGIGVSLNWGRSAIETRSADGPAEHIAAAVEAGVLTGLVFSGCAPVEGPYGAAWADRHLPVRDWGSGPLSDAGGAGILTRREVERCVGLALGAADLQYLGVKVKAPPATAPEDWLEVIRGNFQVLAETLAARAV